MMTKQAWHKEHQACFVIVVVLMMPIQLPEGDSSRSSHVERIDTALHRDDGFVVAGVDGLLREPVAFGAEYDDQFFFVHKGGMVDGEGVGCECESHGFEAHGSQLFHAGMGPVGDIGPRDLENGTHADPYATAVERVAAGGGEEDGIHSQCCRCTEDGTGVGAVDYVVDEYKAFPCLAETLHIGQNGAMHGTKHSAGEFVACE